MSCSYGDKFKITIFGQSHSEAIGVVIDGIPAGIKLDMEKIKRFTSRRNPGQSDLTTTRKEADEAQIVSGIVDGITCGAPLCAIIKNTNQHSADYENLLKNPRPSHADFTAYMKHNGFNDIRGGGNFSGRMTAPLCFAGAVAMQMLEEKGIYIGSHIQQIYDVCDKKFNPTTVNKNDFENLHCGIFSIIDKSIADTMAEKIEDARKNLDSLGGIIECAVVGMKPGIGEPIFDGIENEISKIIFGIPAIKGIEFGNGFDCVNLTGSQNNDAFEIINNEVKTSTNNHGGILGGISSGMPIIFRVAVKPTPSIGKVQNSVNLAEKKNEQLTIVGRHDPCIVPRAVPCVEAATAIAIINLL